MGLFGWDLIKSNVTLEGMVSGTADFSHDDGDWEFNIPPDPHFLYLLTNPDNYTNQNSMVQCEVRPPDSLQGQFVRSMGELGTVANETNTWKTETWVRVVGSWVRDRSHSVYDENIVPDVSSLPGPKPNFLPDELSHDPVSVTISTVAGIVGKKTETDWHTGKTEIHPITSVLAIHSATPNNRTRLVEFFVFSDAKNLDPEKNQSPYPLPDGDGDNNGAFSITLPTGTTGFSKEDEIDRSISHLKTTFVQHQRYTQLEGVVHVGKVSDGNGFYWVGLIVPGWTLLTYLLDRNINYASGIRKVMSLVGVKTVREMFTKLDTKKFNESV